MSASENHTLRTAFVIFVDHQGRTGFSSDRELLSDLVSIEKTASMDEMYGAAANVMREITSQSAAMQLLDFQRRQERLLRESSEFADSVPEADSAVVE